MLEAPDPNNNIDISGIRVHFSCGGEAVTMIDFESGLYRPSTAIELYDLARLTDSLEHIHRFSNIVGASEIGDLRKFDLTRTYASASGTTKVFGMSCSDARHMDELIAMLDVIAGGEGEFFKRTFCIAGGCAIVSPLTCGDDNSEVVVASQAGALTLNTAETLARLLMVNLIRPGHRMSFSN